MPGIAVAPDGRIVVGGDTLARYTADGRLDTSLDGDGVVSDTGSLHAVALQADGRIVVGGSVEADGGRFSLRRYGPDGTADPGFGGDGTITTDIGGLDGGVRGLAIQPDGRIVASGYRWSGGCGIFGCGSVATLLLARYDGD